MSAKSEVTEDNGNENSDSAEKKKKQKKGHHTCLICEKVFTRRYDYNLHNRRKHDIDEIKCNICGKGFLTETDLKYHKKIHTGTHNYACEYCARRFDRPARWKLHMEKIHKAKQKYDYRCWRCKKEFEDSETLISHMTVHRTELCYECYLCYQKFEGEQSLEEHMERKHLAERKFKCDKCGISFLTNLRLRWHLAQGCKSAARLCTCEKCRTAYTTQSRLDRHNMSRHIGFTEEELWNAMSLARNEGTVTRAINTVVPDMSDKLVVLWTNKFDDDFKTARLKFKYEDLIVCTFDTVWDKKYLRLLSNCIEFDSTAVVIRLPNSKAHILRVFTFGTRAIPDGWKNRTFSTYRNFEKRLSKHAKERNKTLYHIVSSDKKNIFTRQCAASLTYSTVFAI